MSKGNISIDKINESCPPIMGSSKTIHILVALFYVLLISTATIAKPVDLTEMSLEELMDVRIQPVKSASKYEQKSIDAPSAMTVVTADQIQKFGYRTLADILRSVRGFYIRYDRNYDYVGFRGFNRIGDYSTRVLLLVDGARINDNIYDSAPVGTDFILDPDIIERIEIVRGPSYTLYGSNAFFATINVITKDTGSMNGGEAAISAGSYETYNTRLSYGKKLDNGSHIMFSGSLYDSNDQSHYFPEFDTIEQNNGISENNDGDEAKSLYAKYSKGIITISSAYVKRGKELPTAPWNAVFNNDRTKTLDERAFIDLKLEKTLNTDLTIMGRLTFGGYHYSGNYLFVDENTEENYINRDEQKGEWGGIEAHIVKSFENHKVVFGGEYKDNFTLDQKNFNMGGETYLDDSRTFSHWGMFLQDEFPIFQMLKLNTGIRYDHYSTFGGTLNPRIALIFRPFEDTSIKYLAGRSFRAPDPYEMFYNDGELTQRANPDLGEESLVSHELVWEQLIGKNLSGTVSVFHHTIKNLISQTIDNDGLIVFLNQDNVKTTGYELELNAFFGNGFTSGVNYTFQKSDYQDSDKVWINSPGHMAKLNLSIPLIPERMFLSMEEQYISSLETLSGGSAGDYYITNLTLLWREAFKGLDISGSVYNLFDKDYGFPAGDEHAMDIIKQDGVNFRLKLIYSF